MEVGVLSMRYAKAMIEYAQEKGVEDKTLQRILHIVSQFSCPAGTARSA